jgi:hypothetical protein
MPDLRKQQIRRTGDHSADQEEKKYNQQMHIGLV